ncbi:hypothetical protein HG537_0B01020 [Torulaspora globosa]|uniref:FH2-domain-containing protein n=1 Tax=Torulaspora globosa TaxID=48254 RepID=A0A7H9HN88_9SACH|nr:hypothetical protein HG537_0B01020 [Torulaspora sp. CBS 2947]
MLRSSQSKHSGGGGSSNNTSSSGLLNNLKRLTNSTGGHNRIETSDITSPKKVSVPSRVSNATDLRPLNKKSTLNTQNLSHYVNGKSSGESIASDHSRAPSVHSATKYTYSRRSSAQLSTLAGGSMLTREPTNQSLASSSLHSQGSHSNLAKFMTSDGNIKLDMPKDHREIETLFEDMMYKRNILQNLSPEKQQDLMDYDVEKKWLIVKQDLQNELKKVHNNAGGATHASLIAANGSTQSQSINHTSPRSSLAYESSLHGSKPSKKNSTSSHGSKLGNKSKLNQLSEKISNGSSSTTEKVNLPPIYYVKKIIADKLTNDDISDLWITLRTEQLGWVDTFLELQGHIAMANVLITSIYKTDPSQPLTPELLEKEIAFFRCFRVLSVLSQGLYELSRHSIMTDTIANGLFSVKLATRKMATEIMVCMLERRDKARFEAVLNALDKKFKIGENLHMVHYIKNLPQHFIHFSPDSHFKVIQSWLFAVEQTLEGRGKMGSLVGASEDYKASGGENAILEYSQWIMVFINHFCNGTDVVNQRILLRSRLENAGGLRIMNKFRLLDYDKLTEQIEDYENSKLDDLNSILETNAPDPNIDMEDPVALLRQLTDHCKGTENEKLLNSLIKHLFLSSRRLLEEKEDPTKLSKQLKLMDSLVTNVSVSAVDESSSINMAIQRLYDSMQTDEVARRAILESRTLTKKLEEIEAERDYLNEKLNKAGNGLVGKLEEELKERDRILDKNQRVTLQLQSELEELKKKHLLEKHEHEVELRKMLTILNSRQSEEINVSGALETRMSPGTLDPDKKNSIQKALQDGLRKTEKDLSIDSKRFGITVQPNKRLRMLRLRMEDIEQEARQLEMTNFADHEKKTLQAPVQINKKRDPEIEENIKANKLSQLRKALAEIQNESNSISKFNVDERVKELFNNKRLVALQRLKDLEAMYDDYRANGNAEIFFGDASDTTSLDPVQDLGLPTLDPKAAESKLAEMDRITSELTALKNELQTTDLRAKTTVSSPLEEIQSTSVDASEIPREKSQNFVTGSFLEALSQKYATGTDHRDSSLRNYDDIAQKKKDQRRSFVERMKRQNKTNLPISQLSDGLEEETEQETEQETDSASESLMKEGKSLELPQSENDSNSVDAPKKTASDEERPAALPPVAPPLPEMMSNKISESSAIPPPPPPPLALFNSANKMGHVPSPPPPPPPPPPPNFISKTDEGHAPPPPPLPPSFTPGSSKSGTTPPPPPPPPIGKIDRSASPSPLLPESPSPFNSYPRARKKLKQLHWEKLDSTDDSIWSSGKAEKFAGDLYEKGVLADLEKAFAAREIKSLRAKKKDDLDKITFLSRDISQQFGINLHMYSQLPVEEVVRRILKCDKDFLGTPSVIEFLSKPEIIEVTNNLARNFAPYSTDWDGVTSLEDAKSPEKDPAELQRADQIYLQLIYNLQIYWGSRMRALKVVTSYEREYSELMSKLRKVDKAVAAIQKSANLGNIFNVILAVGNYMNDASKQAHGFKLSTLQRLTFIKDSDNNMTFLNYVEKIVRDNYPSFNEFLIELQPVLDVVKISIEQLVHDCNSFSQSVKNVQRSVEIGNLSDSSKFHPHDKVLTKVLPVLSEASKKVELLDEEVKLSLMEFESLMQRYGEDSADKFAKNSFFKKFADFINEYKKSQAQNLKAEEEERLYQKHKKMVEEQQRKAEAKANTSNGTSEQGSNDTETEDRREIMDKLLEQLKNAAPTRTDPSSARKRAMIRKKLLTDKEATSNALQFIDNDEDSIIYSPEKDNDKEIKSGEERSAISASPSTNQNDDHQSAEPIVDRAKALLLGLRGDESPSKPNTTLSGHKEKLRARRRKTNTEISPNESFSFSEEIRETVSSADTNYSNDTNNLNLTSLKKSNHPEKDRDIATSETLL